MTSVWGGWEMARCKYSGDLKTKLVWYLNGQKEVGWSGLWMPFEYRTARPFKYWTKGCHLVFLCIAGFRRVGLVHRTWHITLPFEIQTSKSLVFKWSLFRSPLYLTNWFGNVQSLDVKILTNNVKNLNVKKHTNWFCNVQSLISANGDVLQIRAESVQLLSQERSDPAEDPDVALQLEDGVVQLSSISLVQTLLILFFSKKR